MKKNIKVIYVLNFIFFALIIFSIARTYAVFESEADGIIEEDIARWNIKVNNSDIVESDIFTTDDINWDSSERIITGKTAPGISGDYHITIDPTGTEVAVKVVISFDFSGLVNSEFQVTSVVENAEDGNLIKTGESEYTEVITLDEIDEGYISDIVVRLLWNNNEDNNEEDYKLGSSYNKTISIPVTVKALQYTGEEISPYVPEEDSEEESE